MSSVRETGKSFKAGSTAEIVLGRIRKMIETGELRPGDRLPAERELSERLKMSRGSLRAALHSLAGMGLLQARHGSGTYITDGPPVFDEGPLSMLAHLHGISDDEMFEARRQLEVGVAGLAAERAELEHLVKMQADIRGMAEALDDPPKYLMHDMSFHRQIAQASKNPILSALVEMVAAALYRERSRTVSRALDLKTSLAMHRRLYKAIESRNAEQAREAMNEHLERAQRSRHLESAAHKTEARARKAPAPVRVRRAR